MGKRGKEKQEKIANLFCSNSSRNNLSLLTPILLLSCFESDLPNFSSNDVISSISLKDIACIKKLRVTRLNNKLKSKKREGTRGRKSTFFQMLTDYFIELCHKPDKQMSIPYSIGLHVGGILDILWCWLDIVGSLPGNLSFWGGWYLNNWIVRHNATEMYP